MAEAPAPAGGVIWTRIPAAEHIPVTDASGRRVYVEFARRATVDPQSYVRRGLLLADHFVTLLAEVEHSVRGVRDASHC